MAEQEVQRMLARNRQIRPWRALAYFLLASGGLIIWVDPTRQMDGVPFLIRWVWTGFIVIGGLVSMFGAVTDKWLYEFIALPLVIVGFSGMVFVLVAGGGSTGRLAFACWLMSIVVQTGRRYGSLWHFSATIRRARRGGGKGA